MDGVPNIFNTLISASVLATRSDWSTDPAPLDDGLDRAHRARPRRRPLVGALRALRRRGHGRPQAREDPPGVRGDPGRGDRRRAQVPARRSSHEIAIPSDKIQFGIPDLEINNITGWYNQAEGGHIGFSPVVPLKAENIREVRTLLRTHLEEEAGLDFLVGPAHDQRAQRDHGDDGPLRHHRPGDDDARLRRRPRPRAEAGRRGYGEYRAHLHFMDLAQEQYAFGDHAYRRFCETIKDAVDPEGHPLPGTPRDLAERDAFVARSETLEGGCGVLWRRCAAPPPHRPLVAPARARLRAARATHRDLRAIVSSCQTGIDPASRAAVFTASHARRRGHGADGDPLRPPAAHRRRRGVGEGRRAELRPLGALAARRVGLRVRQGRARAHGAGRVPRRRALPLVRRRAAVRGRSRKITRTCRQPDRGPTSSAAGCRSCPPPRPARRLSRAVRNSGRSRRARSRSRCSVGGAPVGEHHRRGPRARRVATVELLAPACAGACRSS